MYPVHELPSALVAIQFVPFPTATHSDKLAAQTTPRPAVVIALFVLADPANVEAVKAVPPLPELSAKHVAAVPVPTAINAAEAGDPVDPKLFHATAKNAVLPDRDVSVEEVHVLPFVLYPIMPADPVVPQATQREKDETHITA